MGILLKLPQPSGRSCLAGRGLLQAEWIPAHDPLSGVLVSRKNFFSPMPRGGIPGK